MALKKVYFLSDLHLGASYFADPRAKERAVVQWLDSIKNTAAEIYLLGDILDRWCRADMCAFWVSLPS